MKAKNRDIAHVIISDKFTGCTRCGQAFDMQRAVGMEVIAWCEMIDAFTKLHSFCKEKELKNASK